MVTSGSRSSCIARAAASIAAGSLPSSSTGQRRFDGGAALEAERRKPPRLLDEHLEDRRLRDDARALDAEVGEREAKEAARAAIDLEPADLRLRQAVEPGAETHLRECVDAARHERLAAELAREVGMALEERDGNVAAGEKIGERGARGSGADDDDLASVLDSPVHLIGALSRCTPRRGAAEAPHQYRTVL